MDPKFFVYFFFEKGALSSKKKHDMMIIFFWKNIFHKKISISSIGSHGQGIVQNSRASGLVVGWVGSTPLTPLPIFPGHQFLDPKFFNDQVYDWTRFRAILRDPHTSSSLIFLHQIIFQDFPHMSNFQRYLKQKK